MRYPEEEEKEKKNYHHHHHHYTSDELHLDGVWDKTTTLSIFFSCCLFYITSVNSRPRWPKSVKQSLQESFQT
jgi:hypothetical protein